jgi:hypothetical protein
MFGDPRLQDRVEKAIAAMAARRKRPFFMVS